MRRNFILLAALLIVAVAAYSDQPIFGPRDPDAARKNLSNVTPATGRAALELGTMATEAKTDYSRFDTTGSFSSRIDFNSASRSNFTATPTFAGVDAFQSVTDALASILGESGSSVYSILTGHIASTGTSVHGLGTMSTQSTDTYAASSATVLTSGANAMTGNLRLGGKWLSNDGGDEGVYVATGGNVLIGTTSDDGTNKLQVNGDVALTGNMKFASAKGIMQQSDSGITTISGGSSWAYTKGSAIGLYGISVTGSEGILEYYAGNHSNGHHRFLTGAGSERMRITYGGNVLIGTTSDDGTHKLQVNGAILATTLKLSTVPVYADNAAATTGGLAAGQIYRTSTGVLMIVY